MVNFGRLTIAGLQTSSQRLIAATMVEPRNSLFVLRWHLLFSFIVFPMSLLEI